MRSTQIYLKTFLQIVYSLFPHCTLTITYVQIRQRQNNTFLVNKLYTLFVYMLVICQIKIFNNLISYYYNLMSYFSLQ